MNANPNAEPAPTRPPANPWLIVAIVVCGLALLSSGLLWQKLRTIQANLASQSAEATSRATEARLVAKDAQDATRDTAARVALMDARVSEVALQRSQLDELMQSLSRARDENLVVDIESSLRLAQQQALLTGSIEPLMAALKTADLRITRAAQPRLAPLQKAIGRDMVKVKAATVTDTVSLLNRLDELTRMVDDMPLANAVPPLRGLQMEPPTLTPKTGWQHIWQSVMSEARGLVRVSQIGNPEAALLSPEQSFFVRENVKLKLLNARLGLLARQIDTARADVVSVSVLVERYFDATARRTQTVNSLLQQTQAQMRNLELPRIDDSLTALATAASGK